ncbi:MAG: WGR domain-containing protein [Myxococcaceae bacterium]|nr:WGR domain-containing protein [Myxococcaceae bacterium]
MSVLEEVVLNWTDLTGKKTGATSLGSNKFYKAQLMKDGAAFKVVFTYGRVGQAGQTQIVKAPTLEKAKKELESKINSKIKKGYQKVDLRTVADEAKKAGVKAAPAKKVARKSSGSFHPEVESLLELLYGSTGHAVAAGLSASSGATDDAPLGNLSDKQIDKGADLLEEIETLLGKGKPKKDVLLDLTNEYLSAIPRRIDHARSGGKLDLDKILINSEDRIKEQRTFLGLLRDAFLQKAVFEEAAHVADPAKVWYDGLKCDIAFIEPKSDEYKHIKKLFDTGQSPINSNFYGKLKLARVWKLEQQGRKPAFDAYAAKIAKAKGATGVIPGWHGTRTENLMGICKTGLLMPKNLPKGVQVTGRAFGLGIYHTPCWPDSGGSTKDEKGKSFTRYNGALKSMNYSSLRGAFYFRDNTADRGYMFLEELALGVPELALKACFNKPSPDKGKDYIYARAHGHQSLSNDEVVTFDEHASRRTAIVEVVYK